MIQRPPKSTLDRSSAASDVYKRQTLIFAIHPYHHRVPNESIQNLIFAAVTSDDDEAMSIERIDDALAKGADFTSDDVALLLSLIPISEPTRPY